MDTVIIAAWPFLLFLEHEQILEESKNVSMKGRLLRYYLIKIKLL